MDATKSRLFVEFSRLSLNSMKSVQNGQNLSSFDAYLHVTRPVENVLRAKMDELEHNNGGIVFLIGSAGDGKSHLLSRVRGDYDWSDQSFYNDATISCSPSKTAVETLKNILADFSDASIDDTTRKMVLAINLGKLNALVEDNEVKQTYSKIVKATASIFDESVCQVEESQKIKIVLFTEEQIFELVPSSHDIYPVQSDFLYTILEKIVAEDEQNPFWQAYLSDQGDEDQKNNPILMNYEILRSPVVRNTIVKSVIEAIVRFQLIITTREFLDFVFSIMVGTDLNHYEERTDFFKALLPTLLYQGGNNLILKAISKLDPILYSNLEHDQMLVELFTSYAIPPSIAQQIQNVGMPNHIVTRVNSFYSNNGRDLEATTQFVFRLFHVLSYHSECPEYIKFISSLPKFLMKDKEALSDLYETVGRVLPRHFGSFYDKPNMIPLNIQGGEYKLFTNLEIVPELIESNFDPDHPTKFPLHVTLSWFVQGKSVKLKVDYQLFCYLTDLDKGRLITSYSNERNSRFGIFVRDLASMSNNGEVTIVKCDGEEKKLRKIIESVRLS